MSENADGQHDHDDHEHVHGEHPHQHEGPSCEHGDHCCGNCNHDHHEHDHEHEHGHPHEHANGEHHHGEEDHDHEHHDHEHHDHEHHEHEHEHAPAAKEKFSLRSAFHKVVDYIKNNKAETASLGLASTILLASTALTVPLLPATLSAMALGAASIYLLKKTSDTALDNAMAFGKKLAMSPMKLGLAVGALTTIPELMVSLNALVHGQNEIAIGNVLGGNIAHTLLILGATAAIAGIGAGKKGLSWAFNTKVMAWATGLFAGEMALGSVLPPAADQIMYPLVGLGMLGMAGYYLKQRLLARDQDNAAAAADGKECATGACPFHDHHGDDHEHHDHDHDHAHEHGDDPLDDGHNHGNSHDGKAGPNPDSMPSWFNAAWCAAGMAGLAGASKLLVDSASQFGAGAGLSNDFIGAVAVGLGVALPELILSVKAAMKKQGEFALGNVIGCNIFTTLLVGGAVSVAGAVAPEAMKIATPEAVLNTAAFAGSAGLATAALLSNKGGLKKWHGWAGMAMYAAYAATAWMLGHQAPTVQTPQTTPAPIIQQQQLPAPLKAPATQKVVLNEMPKFVEESPAPDSIKTSKNSPATAGASSNFMPPAEHLKPAPFALF